MTTQERASKDEQALAQKAVRIVLADDHQVMRRGIQTLLNAEPGFVVVAEVGGIDSARRYEREHHPNVLLLDLNMPGGPGLEAIPKLRAEAPDTQIVVLTMHEEPAFVRAALRAGALGYVLKEASDTELVRSIRAAAAGEVYLNRGLAGQLITDRLRTRAGTERSGPALVRRVLSRVLLDAEVNRGSLVCLRSRGAAASERVVRVLSREGERLVSAICRARSWANNESWRTPLPAFAHAVAGLCFGNACLPESCKRRMRISSCARSRTAR